MPRTEPGEDRYPVSLTQEAQQEVEALEPALQRAFLGVVVALELNPWLGESADPDGEVAGLENCRKVYLDEPRHEGKPRFRVVYENLPADGAPAEVTVLAVASRAHLIAYERSARRRERGE